jgi:hypothetical protein
MGNFQLFLRKTRKLEFEKNQSGTAIGLIFQVLYFVFLR